MTSEMNVLIFSFLGGIIPAFFWLWFWMREDRLHPEPKSALFSSFFGGILAVLIALFFELIFYYLLISANPHYIKDFPSLLGVPLQNLADRYNLLENQTQFWSYIQNIFNSWNFSFSYNIEAKKFFLLVIIAPITEEFLKLALTYGFCLRRKINDEPIDAAIYMLTAALGFASVETALFLTDPLTKGNILDTFIAGNFRSIGPMLIHLICSAMLGIFIGLAFYKSRIKKFFYLIGGFIVVSFLHSLFNFFIMLNDTTHNIAFFWTACIGTWILVAILLIFFERVKRVTLPINKLD